MAVLEPNWYKRYKKSFGPGLSLECNNPTQGVGGASAFNLFATTESGKKCVFGMKQDGKAYINADVSIEIIAGEENTPKNTDILIHSRNGTIDIKVDKNGAVRINGANVQVVATKKVTVSGYDIRLKADNEISLQANCIRMSGLCGNGLPKTFTDMATLGSFIGAGPLAAFKDKALNLASGFAGGGLPGGFPLGPEGFGNLNADALTGNLTAVLDKAGPGLSAITENGLGAISNLDLSSTVGSLNNITGQFGSALPGMQNQLLDMKQSVIPGLESFASGTGADIGSKIKDSGVFTNITGQLNKINIPKGL